MRQRLHVAHFERILCMMPNSQAGLMPSVATRCGTDLALATTCRAMWCEECCCV